MSSYDTNLEKNKANYIPLTPLSFLERAKEVYPNYEAIVYEDIKYTCSVWLGDKEDKKFFTA
mgnify:CR=1 FL=1